MPDIDQSWLIAEPSYRWVLVQHGSISNYFLGVVVFVVFLGVDVVLG